MDEVKEILNQPSSLGLLIGLVLAFSPLIWKLIKWFWTTTKDDVKKDIEKGFEQKKEELKIELLKKQTELEVKIADQTEFNKDTLSVVKDSVSAMREENKVNHESSKQLLSIMEMHLEELKFLKIKVNDHEDRIMKVEKITGK
jgi:predicted O-linked N-acetylglucosamine transferase (SPINDLY family)